MMPTETTEPARDAMASFAEPPCSAAVGAKWSGGTPDCSDTINKPARREHATNTQMHRLGREDAVENRESALRQGNTPECEESVIEKIRLRREAGRRKYGTTMERNDLNRLQWLQHAQEEAMDLSIYLERLIRDERRNDKAEPSRIEEPL